MSTPKILLVNDDQASLFALETLLEGGVRRNEYKLVTARSGEEALRQVLKHDFSVILLDVSMPIMDGFEAAEAIHSHPRSASVPIIFLTAHYADEMNRLKGYQKGAVDYLFYPIIPQILQTKISVFVELTKKNLELEHKSERLAVLNRNLRVQRMHDLESINLRLQEEIEERKLAEERAHELAIRDPLTGLFNRRSFIEHLDHATTYALRHNDRIALLFLDLDKFKNINDTLGHETGDELLRQVAIRLLDAVREADIVARLGGDEFVVLLEGLTDPGDATSVAQKVAQALSEQYDIGVHCVHTSASIGISRYPEDGNSVKLLMKNADLAMYHAKHQKRGSIQFYREELNHRQNELDQLEGELQHALDANALTLLYRPRVNLVSGRLSAVEVVPSWQHPRLGLITRQQFMSNSVSGNLRALINEWVISASCEQLRTWLDAGVFTGEVPIEVDMIFPQVHAELSTLVLRTLRKYKIPPSYLQLGLGESLLSHDMEQVSTVLHELHREGLAITVDDFGTGCSSLAIMKTLPLAAVKIDGIFMRELVSPESDTAVIGAIVNLAHALALRVVANGVQSAGQIQILENLGCDECQGEFICAPLPASAMEEKLRGAILH
jgi:diguanylate cyclase (GGDEF)-like protein